MRKASWYAGACLILASICLQPAAAQERRGRGGPDPEMILDRFDTNEDGKLTSDEIPEQAGRFLLRLDRDGDGEITREEMSQMRGRGRAMGAGGAAAQSGQAAAMMSGFENSAPTVGALLPDLTLYDDQGEKINLREITKGQYTVLVFGCLT